MDLNNKIWLTRKCRMASECRLNRYDFISKILITYYSAFIIILSLFDVMNPRRDYNLSIISASVLILIISLIITSMRFKERAFGYKQCYIKLNELQEEAKKNLGDKVALDNIFKQYNDVLNLTENHSEYDYYKVKFFDKSKEEYLSISYKEQAKLFLHWFCMIIMTIIFIAFPALIFLFDC